MVLDSFFNAIFGPLLNHPPIILVIVVSVFMLLLTSLIQKFTTNQTEMKSLKDRQKEYQKQMKEHKADPKKVMEIQKQSMEVNMKYMRHSFKPMLFTFLPIIIIFGWMNSMLLFGPIEPGAEFTVTVTFDDVASGTAELVSYEGLTLLSEPEQELIAVGKEKAVQWKLTGPQGTYPLEIAYNDDIQTTEVIIGEANVAREGIKMFKGEDLKALRIDYPKLIVLDLFGWKIGWLGTYIIIALLLSGPIRKLLRVH